MPRHIVETSDTEDNGRQQQQYHRHDGVGSPSSYTAFTTATLQHNANEDGDGPMVIRVLAPATLQEGYTFDVLVDDEPYTVRVPVGGVQEGEEFDVLYEPVEDHLRHQTGMHHHHHQPNRLSDMPEEGKDNQGMGDEDTYGGGYDDDKGYPHDRPKKTFSRESIEDDDDSEKEEDNAEDSSKAIWYDENGTPIGGWRTSLCSCCDVLTQSTFWMGLCCTPILMAQLITRLKLTWNGQAGAPLEETALSYNRIVLSLLMVTMTLWKIPFVGGFSLLLFYIVVVVYIGSHVRAHMRQRYKIPATSCCLPQTSCGQRVGDTLAMLACGCCASIQMARHTHDDKDYPGHGCTTTGLGLDAPEIV